MMLISDEICNTTRNEIVAAIDHATEGRPSQEVLRNLTYAESLGELHMAATEAIRANVLGRLSNDPT